MPRSVQEERTDVNAHMVTYQYYDKVKVATSYFEEDGVTPKMSERLQLVRKTVPMGESMAFYRKQLQYYVFHYHIYVALDDERAQRAGVDPPWRRLADHALQRETKQTTTDIDPVRALGQHCNDGRSRRRRILPERGIRLGLCMPTKKGPLTEAKEPTWTVS